MIVADASALATLAVARVLGVVREELDVHTTVAVVEALEAASGFHGPYGDGARAAIGHCDGLVVHREPGDPFESSRVDASQGGCASLAVALGAELLLTDDFGAVPELSRIAPCDVACPPVVIAALVRRGTLARQDARFRLEALLGSRDWLGRPVYRRYTASLDVG